VIRPTTYQGRVVGEFSTNTNRNLKRKKHDRRYPATQSPSCRHERQLAHADHDANGAAYDGTQHFPERKRISILDKLGVTETREFHSCRHYLVDRWSSRVRFSRSPSFLMLQKGELTWTLRFAIAS